MTKKILFIYSALLLALVIVYSCSKMAANKDMPFDPLQSRELVQINTWLEKQKAIAGGEDLTRIKNIQENLDVNKLWTEDYAKGEHFIAVPLLQGFKSANNPGKASKALLLLFVGDTGIRRGNIVQYYNPKEAVTLKQGTFGKVFTSKQPDFSGTLSFSTVTDSRAFDLSYEKGKMVSYSKPMFKTNKSANGRLDECYARYLVTYYTDGTEDWEYLYTWCKVTDDCNTTKQVNGVALKSGLFCGDGGDGTPPPDCCFPDGDITMNSESSSMELSALDGVVVTNASGFREKTRLYSWEYCRNAAAWYKWSYISYEKAVLTDASGEWKFKDFKHSGEGMTGMAPPCLTFSCKIIHYAYEFFNADRSVAMTAQWEETHVFSCLPGASPHTDAGTSVHIFNAA